MVHPVCPDVLKANHMVVAALANSLGKPFPWAGGYLFGNTELILDPWNVIPRDSGFDN